LSGDGRIDWRLRAVLTSVMLCHRLWASFSVLLVLLFSSVVSGQLEWKCKREREKETLVGIA